MTPAKNERNHKVILYILIVFLFLVTFRFLANAFLPFIIAFLFAVLIRSFVGFVENVTGMNTKISAGICATVCYALFFLAVFLTAKALICEAISLFDNLPRIYETSISPLLQKAEQFLLDLNGGGGEFKKIMASFLENAEGEIISLIKTLSGNAAEKIGQTLLKIPEIFITITVTIVASFFISIDYDSIKKFFLSHARDSHKHSVSKIKGVFFDAVGKMCVAYLLIFIITFAELVIGLFLLRVKYALVISFVIAVADIFPIIGTGTILIPWSILELLNGNKPLSIGLLTIFLIISVVRNIIEPKLIGQNSGIHPLVTMIAMYVGLKIGGVMYAILLPFIVIIIKRLKENTEFLF